MKYSLKYKLFTKIHYILKLNTFAIQGEFCICAAHNAVIDNKYMKLFDARPNAIHTFGLHIKQFLSASNIDFSDSLETSSYQTTKDYSVSDASIYQKFFMEIQDRYHNCTPIYTDSSSWKFCGLCYNISIKQQFP